MRVLGLHVKLGIWNVMVRTKRYHWAKRFAMGYLVRKPLVTRDFSRFEGGAERHEDCAHLRLSDGRIAALIR